MTKTVDEAISEVQAEIAEIEATLRSKKETVNTLCIVLGRSPLYAVTTSQQAAIPNKIRPDQFYGQPLASAVRLILEMRQAANMGAASVAEIFDVLKSGGYLFDTKNEEIARKSLRNSLAKNTALFHKLPNGRFGMRSWYPKVKGAKPPADGAEDSITADDAVTAEDVSTETPDDGEEAR
jgi:hypothetical protein